MLSKIQITEQLDSIKSTLSDLVLGLMELNEKNLTAIGDSRILHQKLCEASSYANDALQELVDF